MNIESFKVKSSRIIQTDFEKFSLSLYPFSPGFEGIFIAWTNSLGVFISGLQLSFWITISIRPPVRINGYVKIVHKRIRHVRRLGCSCFKNESTVIDVTRKQLICETSRWNEWLIFFLHIQVLVLVGRFVCGERLSGRKLTGICLLTAGVIIQIYPRHQTSDL